MVLRVNIRVHGVAKAGCYNFWLRWVVKWLSGEKLANQFHQGVAIFAGKFKKCLQGRKNELDFRPNLWS